MTTDIKSRMYRGRRQALTAPGLVLVSVCNDVEGARRKLLEPRLPATAARHRPNCACGFDWGIPSPTTVQLGVAILADHFEHHECDLPRAKALLNCPNDPSPLDAARMMAPRFAESVLVPIPAQVRQWTLTTAMIREYLSHLEGASSAAFSPVFDTFEPGEGHRIVQSRQFSTEPNEPDTMVQELAAFVVAVREGRMAPLPEIIASKILEAFVTSIGDALKKRTQLVPVLGAQVGPVLVQLHLFERDERVLLERMCGPERVRAALKTAEEAYGVDSLRRVFGQWQIAE